MEMTRKIILLAVLLSLLFGCGRGIKENSASIAGRVTLETELVYAGAVVSIEGTAITAVTATTGDYLLSNVPAGTHRLIASKTGFVPITREITVGPGSASTGIDFSLILDTPPAPPF
jgi:iron complex outermembrane recepter protein